MAHDNLIVNAHDMGDIQIRSETLNITLNLSLGARIKVAWKILTSQKITLNGEFSTSFK